MGRKTMSRTHIVVTLSCLVMFAYLCAAGAFAGAYSGGSGIPDTPYLIESADDILEMSETSSDWNAHFLMIADVNMIGRTFDRAAIAPDGNLFTGFFDGNGHEIENLAIEDGGAGYDYLGLFGRIGKPGQVKNLGLKNVSISGGDGSRFLGGLCGTNGGTITNCFVTGSVSGGEDSSCLGGLCGDNYYYGTIINCYATGSVNGGDDSVGLGGLCGGHSGRITNCYSSGSVTGGDDSGSLGGLCGGDYGGTTTNCYATGSVTGGAGSWDLGGLCGASVYYDRINNCYATGVVTSGAGSRLIGGFLGSAEDGAGIWSCFWDTDVYIRQGLEVPKSIGAVFHFDEPVFTDVDDLTTAQMWTQGTYTQYDWDFVGESVNGPADVWRMCVDGVGYPRLSWEYSQSGDIDCPDGVSIEDLAYLVERWLMEGSPELTGAADTNGDSIVDMRDYVILANKWIMD